MASGTFKTPASLKGVAIGFRPSGAVGIQYHSDAWGAPAGDLLVSANDMAKWMTLWARRDQPKNRNALPTQILDGATLDEMLQPVVEMRDGRAAIGKPWEFLYSNGLWLKSKQGGDPGYRSSLTLSTDLELGVFISALTDPVAENSVYTIPIVDILAPVLTAILTEQAERKAVVIAQPERFVGNYYGKWRVWQASPSVLQASFGGSTLNLTASGFDEAAFRVVPGMAAGRAIGCRWLDDGVDEEIAYFDLGSGESVAVSFMGSKWERLHQD